MINKLPLTTFISKLEKPVPKKDLALIYYTKESDGVRNVTKIKYKKPLAMCDALINARQILDNIFSQTPYKFDEFNVLWRCVRENPVLKDKKVNGVFMPGHTSVALELSNGEVFKLSNSHPLHNRKENKTFDVPFLSPVKTFIDKGRDYYYYILAKANTGAVSRKHVIEVRNNIKKSGFCPVDITPERLDQVGIYKKRPCLIDSECAQ